MSLFRRCEICQLTTESTICQEQGTYIAVRQRCECGYTRRWESQPKIKGVPAGNLLISAGILFSGCSPTKILRLFSFINIACISIYTFFSHQKNVLWPAVESVWGAHSRNLLGVLGAREGQLVVAGDGRSDSPGHSAKYGAYTLIDMKTGKIIAMELVQVCLFFFYF